MALAALAALIRRAPSRRGADRSVPMLTTARAPGTSDGTTDGTGADLIAAAAALSNDELGRRLDGLISEKAAIEGAIVVLLGEVARRQSYRAEGATGPVPCSVCTTITWSIRGAGR